MGNLKYFLGVEVVRSKQEIYLSQVKYALDILHDLSSWLCDFRWNKSETQGWCLATFITSIRYRLSWYRRLVGRLLYLQLRDQTSSTLLISLANSWTNPDSLIRKLLSMLFITSNHLPTLVSYSFHLAFSSYMQIIILIGLGVPITRRSCCEIDMLWYQLLLLGSTYAELDNMSILTKEKTCYKTN